MSDNQYNQEVNLPASLSEEILHRQDPEQAEHLSRFFKTGKRDEQRLREWLEPRRATMPRTMLRYAIERFPEEERKRMLER